MAAFAGLAITTSAVQAEEISTSGTICWTGDIEYFGTGEQDNAWVWSINWTYWSDDKDPGKGATGECHGSGR